MSIDTIADELRGQLPHLDVAEATWKFYARNLAAWLDFAGLAYVEGEGLRGGEFPADDSLRGRDFYAARFLPDTFMPSVRPHMVLELVEALHAGSLKRSAVYERWGKRNAPGLLRDADSLDLVTVVEDLVLPAAQARILFQRVPTLTTLDVAQLAVGEPNVRAVLKAAQDRAVDDKAEQEIILGFGSANWCRTRNVAMAPRRLQCMGSCNRRGPRPPWSRPRINRRLMGPSPSPGGVSRERT